ncbi:DNA cytosine methyltransferase [Lacticaseibacillus paracasei]|uniref:DNA cytosine methyltransferase n=1 Tax=Lacticaseibacillus paracasei TaxID=1597 RepID=UPI000F0B2FC5|nr:DNA cytosine methyltransferase [Lacticaseibacillus paracasei]RNE05601.1 Modification methylase HhaI [Lacticaseibacillus paracasei]
MKFLDLFAGIGGFNLGMEQAGHQCVGWVEWDKFARQSYQAIHNVKGVWNASDIRTVTASELPRADCWCFGFPCQDISVAGKQKGFTAGKRSSLFFTVTGLIRDLGEEDRPSYLLIENVKNLLSINRGIDFLKLQIELDEIGYDVEWDVIDSAEVVPQHRERIFIVGHLRGRRTRKVFPIIRKGGKADKPDKEIKQIGNIRDSKSFGGNQQVGRVYGIDGIAPTLSTMQGGGQEPKIAIPVSSPDIIVKNQNGRRFKENGDPEFSLTVRDRHGILTNGMKIRKLTPLECWRLQGFPDWAFNRAREAGLSDGQLYKQAGNSVTVPVIKAIADRMYYNDNRQETGEIVKLEEDK